MALSNKHIALIGGGASAIAGGSAGTYYLLQDKTIEHKLIKEGYSLISNDEEYQIVFKEFKDTAELPKLITTTQKTINAQSSISDGATALKNWCKENLVKNLSIKESQNLINNSKKYCTKPPLTIQEKISKNNWNSVQDWNAKFGTIKSPDEGSVLLNDLRNIDGQISDFTAGEQTTKAVAALEKWCAQQKEIKLIDDTNNAIWKKVEARCLEGKKAIL